MAVNKNPFFLDPFGSEIKCPHCKRSFDVDWTTEYGTPLFGTYSVVCQDCQEIFKFVVEVKYEIK